MNFSRRSAATPDLEASTATTPGMADSAGIECWGWDLLNAFSLVLVKVRMLVCAGLSLQRAAYTV